MIGYSVFMDGKCEMGAYLSSMITYSHNLQIGSGKAGENSFIQGGLGALPPENFGI